MSQSIRHRPGMMKLPGDLDEAGQAVQAAVNRVSHARPVWSTWDLSLMVRADRAGRKGELFGGGSSRAPGFAESENRGLETQELEFEIWFSGLSCGIHALGMTNVGYVRGAKDQTGEERSCVVRNGFHRNVFVPALPGGP